MTRKDLRMEREKSAKEMYSELSPKAKTFLNCCILFILLGLCAICYIVFGVLAAIF